MFNKKKILVSLSVITILLSSTIAYGEVGRLQKYDYRSNNNYRNIWVQDYNNNYNFKWEFTYVPNRPVKPVQPWEPVQPERPVEPERPETPPVVAPEVPSVNVSGLSAMEMEVVRLVNIERQKAGLSNLTASSALSRVARTKSEDMGRNNYFSHSSPTYGDPFAMMRQFGISYTIAGENIASGYYSAQSVVRGWMNSYGHRENILNPSFNTIGVGAYEISNGTIYWTQMFTN